MRQIMQNVSPMSNEGRNSYATKQLTDSFMALLAEKSIDDITISELTEKAAVGRATFYRNFNRKEDILFIYLKRLFCEWTDEWKKNENAPLSIQVQALIVHFENHRSFYALLNERKLTYMLKDIIIGICGPKDEYDMLQAYSSSFTAYTLYGWIDTWFQRGMKETSDEIYEMFRLQGL